MKSSLCLAVLFFSALAAFAETPEVKFIADTLVVQTDGTYDADPDLATLTFQIFAQDKTSSARTTPQRGRCNTLLTSHRRMDWRKMTCAAACRPFRIEKSTT
jgi:uncharacterized protein YggE